MKDEWVTLNVKRALLAWDKERGEADRQATNPETYWKKYYDFKLSSYDCDHLPAFADGDLNEQIDLLTWTAEKAGFVEKVEVIKGDWEAAAWEPLPPIGDDGRDLFYCRFGSGETENVNHAVLKVIDRMVGARKGVFE